MIPSSSQLVLLITLSPSISLTYLSPKIDVDTYIIRLIYLCHKYYRLLHNECREVEVTCRAVFQVAGGVDESVVDGSARSRGRRVWGVQSCTISSVSLAIRKSILLHSPGVDSETERLLRL